MTGKNNQGKSTIIAALKLIHYSSKVIGKTSQRVIYNDDLYFILYSNDIEDINIGRMIYNYSESNAILEATFEDEFKIEVILDAISNKILSTYSGRLPKDPTSFFGFIPPLGQFAEQEDILTDAHITRSINSTLAPRHIRNHFLKVLTREEFSLVKSIINQTWEEIELLDIEPNYDDDKIYCFYKEKRFTREIAWAGQGLQVWFQIITHMVRLKDSKILILDEPEIFLHTEKQIKLLHILREYFKGDLIIATHSVELMNAVDISHIVHVKNDVTSPTVKTTTDKRNLEKIRATIGSSFNFIASSFENVDLILFTEDYFDYQIISSLAAKMGIKKNVHNFSINGFMGHFKCSPYKSAYEDIIGKKSRYVLVLDRDFHPLDYLKEIKEEKNTKGISVIYTPGKEIENLFLKPSLFEKIIPYPNLTEFYNYIYEILKERYDDDFGSYYKLYRDYYHLDEKTILKKYSKNFRETYTDEKLRYNLISGKNLLKDIRNYYKKLFKVSLTRNLLIEKLMEINDKEVIKFIKEIYT